MPNPHSKNASYPSIGDDVPRYQPERTYDWNYDHAPDTVEIDVADVPGTFTFCGLPVESPLGVPAGPLLNGRWCLYYASLGFDVVTYKTVRSAERPCYALPNLQPVDCERLTSSDGQVASATTMRGSWAVSYGMPSKSPDVWRRDITETRRQLDARKILSVSVVGTVQEGWTINELAADYAQCAAWAIDAGADTIEANFSCPNVTSRDGQLYQQPEAAAVVAEALRQACGDVPLILKIGHLRDVTRARDFLNAVAPYMNALAMTNSIAARVVAADGSTMFEGQCRGICGAAIRDASIEQVAMMTRWIAETDRDITLIGVGGASSLDDVIAYRNAGAHAVHIATAAMLDPLVAIKIRDAWRE